MRLSGSLLFHLNLSYSSIEPGERGAIVERCYWPILSLLAGRPWLSLCVEASGHTIERIAEIDPGWVRALREYVGEGRVEFIGSGDTQLIGPLVPAEVNRWNQRLGVELYDELLGLRPQTALVNEMAFSQGIVDSYLDAGYRTLVSEWNNPRRTHPEWSNELRYQMVETRSPGGRPIGLLWVDAVAFQKFQRAAVGDMEIEEYRDWVLGHAGPEPRHLFLYASDAEIFDFRPGRYTSEPALDAGCEWLRVGAILDALHAEDLEFTTPSRVCDAPDRTPAEVRLTAFADPIPVKKQAKYNVTRWALSGHDDVGLNRMCYARERLLREHGGSAEDWRGVCRAWASDHRTHLTEARWAGLDRLGHDPRTNGVEVPLLSRAEIDHRGRKLRIVTDGVELVLDTRRGLAIERLGHPAGPRLVGTLQHGYFDDIFWAADFYSGHTVVEIPAHTRVTDLERVEPEIERRPGSIDVTATVVTPLGPLEKRVRVKRDRVELSYRFSDWLRPVGSVRTAFATLDPDTFGGEGVAIVCANGGDPERFELAGMCDQLSSVSPLVSAHGAFGATEGKLTVEGPEAGFELVWDPTETAALPLVSHREVEGRRMCRIAFSLSEVDDTHQEGAQLHDFSVALVPRGLPS